MKVLVSGSTGSFGSALINHLSDFEVDTISLRPGEITPKQASKLSNCDVFIHCGASLNGDFDDVFNSNVVCI